MHRFDESTIFKKSTWNWKVTVGITLEIQIHCIGCASIKYIYGKRLACIKKTAYLSFSYAFSKIWIEFWICILYYKTYYHDKDSLLLGYMTDPWLNSTASVSITRSSCVYILKRSTTIPRQATNQSIGDYRAQSNSHSHSEWNEVSNFDKLRANCNKWSLQMGKRW